MSYLRQILILSLIFVFTAPLCAQEEEALQEEAQEEEAQEEPGEDPSIWRNLLPIPVIITEPAIGEGLGLAVGYFHPRGQPEDAYEPRQIESADVVRDASVSRKPPPTITGAFGAATSNGTYVAGAGHINSFRNDTIRYLGVAAYANIVSDLYIFDQPFEFNLNGYLLYQDLKFRIGESNWFSGFGFSYLDANNEFKQDLPEEAPPGDLFALRFQDVGVFGRFMYESRDDSLMPNTGRLFDVSMTVNDDFLGGDYDYVTVKSKFLSFHQLHPDWVLGWRIEGTWVEGDPPFYAVPWISLRGIPALRYQGTEVGVVEVELRYDISTRWAVVGFAGKGWAHSNILGFDTSQDAGAWGVGGRFLLLKDQNVWVGIDAATGPEDTYYYVQVGHAW